MTEITYKVIWEGNIHPDRDESDNYRLLRADDGSLIIQQRQNYYQPGVPGLDRRWCMVCPNQYDLAALFYEITRVMEPVVNDIPPGNGTTDSDAIRYEVIASHTDSAGIAHTNKVT